MPLTVAILQNRIWQYRVPLFSRMKEQLEAQGITLRLIHGQASRLEKTRGDEGSLDWSEPVKNTFLRCSGRELIWQRLPGDMRRDANLVVVMQENRILSNYPLLVRRRLGGPLIAYWGHGRNYQSLRPAGLLEQWKSWLARRVDWWFAYTEITVDHLVGLGFPPQRITNLQNSIDVSAFRRELGSVTESDLRRQRTLLSIPDDSQVGLYCGSIYPEKRIDLLIQSAEIIKASLPRWLGRR